MSIAVNDPGKTIRLRGLRGQRRERCIFRLSAALGFSLSLAATVTSQGGDLLRGGATAGGRVSASPNGISPGASTAASQARTNALDALARTTRAVQAVEAMQNAARNAAIAGPNNLGANPNGPGTQLPNVPNGLRPGGLEVAAGATAGSSLWRGANLPVETVSGAQSLVNIKQTSQQAILNWKTFNVGKETTVNFDQSAGGATRGQWIAFNKVNDPSGAPSQILGSIKADGQVYVVNQNGIIFGGSSQVNARGLVASSLPINDNLVNQGLLNNRDSQFLFSSLEVPGGSDATPAFKPAPANTPTGKPGDVVVKAGAILSSPSSGDGNGGRVMLVGPNVRNEGVISTPAGQTILAAGNQVAVAAHDGNDPSLRGLDVWVGDAKDSGTATNSGIITAQTGNITLTGKTVDQSGVLDSTTTVALNGRIDIRASHGAVANPNFDNQGAGGFGGPPFAFQKTGTVTFGENSVTRVMPDYTSGESVPGTALPENSQVNVEGLAVHFKKDAMLLAPHADVSVRSGTWPYRDADGNGTTLLPDGTAEGGLQTLLPPGPQPFLFSTGQIYMDGGSFINVAGSTDVSVPLSQSILNVEFRGAEFADSPLQRDSSLRGAPITIDIRRNGEIDGRYWVGTPLGDATGLVGIIQRNVAQLTASGGSVTLQAGGSVVMQQGALVDVSGGWYRNEGGFVQTTRLLRSGQLVEIHNAIPNQRYDGIYTGTFTVNFPKWGQSETFASGLLTGRRYEAPSTQGANGGTLRITAPSMALDGDLRGITVQQPRATTAPPEHSTLSINFSSQKLFATGGGNVAFLPVSPTPPSLTFGAGRLDAPPEFTLVNDTPAPLPTGRLSTVILSPELLDENGFGRLSVENFDGTITVPAGVALTTKPGGSLSLAGANVTVAGALSSPAGGIGLKAWAISPAQTAEFPLVNSGGALLPVPDGTRGFVTLASGASLNAAGLIVDDRPGSPAALSLPLLLDGGRVSIDAFNGVFSAGGSINVNGGVALAGVGAVALTQPGGNSLSGQADKNYGNAGSIAIRTGRDPGFQAVAGGSLSLASNLLGYSGAKGGSLTIGATALQFGGASAPAGVTLLPETFFRTGGFTDYSILTVGAPSSVPAAPGQPDNYIPGVTIASGARVEALAETLLAIPRDPATTVAEFRAVLRETGLRNPATIRFTAEGNDDSFTPTVREVRGDIVVGRGSILSTDPGGGITFDAQTVTINGSVIAPGGTISVKGADVFPLAPDELGGATFALPTVAIGAGATLSAAGTVVYTPDPFKRRTGRLLPGGDITISGNIIASAGAALDVSGASATFDVTPQTLGGIASVKVPLNSGLTRPLFSIQTVPVQKESDGGSLTLSGSQMLFTDATLRGAPGGVQSLGGTLSISSGRFYRPGGARTDADINMSVTQNGVTIPATNTAPGIGIAVLDANGVPFTGMGYFAAGRFASGGFASLDLATNQHGNVRFSGPVDIAATGSLRVATGGVIQADAAVNLSANYAALGQIFRAPINPDDRITYFAQEGANTPIFTFPPTTGAGSLTVTADLIDIGTLSLLGIGRAAFIADGGDIRGNGIFSMAGDLTLRAGQIYPTTASQFDIFAYTAGSRPGTVSIIGSGSRTAPLSAGGELRIYAGEISQGGTLRAPFGQITLGWDGTDLDPTSPELDTPSNPIVGTTAAPPVTSRVILQNGSVTSVAGWTDLGGVEMTVPFGLSTDGSSWIDPRGVNVTVGAQSEKRASSSANSGANVSVGGLPEKRVSISGGSVETTPGSIVDLRGGGDLLAFRWTAGNGGSIDLLGAAQGNWNAASEYQSGDLVSFGGKTWSAKVRSTGETPRIGTFWSEVAPSFAILPGYSQQYAPFGAFNTAPTARLLAGDPGYVDSSLKIGDQIYLEGSSGLPAGTYTLLPRRYALLPGALLVTPKNTPVNGTIAMDDGSSMVAGYRLNAFEQAPVVQTLRSSFEVAPANVVSQRVAYDVYLGNTFFPAAAAQFNLPSIQRLPQDAGSLSLLSTAALRVQGGALTAATGRGSAIDVASAADITIAPAANAGSATAFVDPAVASSWNADSLIIGGRRIRSGTETLVDVRTQRVTLNNPGAPLSGADVTLAARTRIDIAPGSALSASRTASDKVGTLTISGDGTLVRASSDTTAALLRRNTTASTTPLLTIGANAAISGPVVILDSSYGTSIATDALVQAGALDLGSGQISIQLDTALPLSGAVVPQHLVLAGRLLDEAEQASSLTLRSYRTIDLYGAGDFGNAAMSRLTLSAAGLRGFGQGAGTTRIFAGEIATGNPSAVATLAAPGATGGTLQFDARVFRFGENAFGARGWQNVAINATGGVLGSGAGSFGAPGGITISAPFIGGVRGSTQSITAGGALSLQNLAGTAAVSGGPGAALSFTGSRVNVATDILLPSGQLTLRATGAGGDVTVSSRLDVGAVGQTFYNVTRFPDAGSISLISERGGVALLPGSTVSVAGAAGGGNAGLLGVQSPQGTFSLAGATLLGGAATGETTGRFTLDTGSLPSFADLASALNSGGFFQERAMRVRSGNVDIVNAGGAANVARVFSLSLDSGTLTVSGTIDASGITGGEITLVSGGSVVLGAGSLLTARGEEFSSAGKGGEIRIEAGSAVNGVANATALLTMQPGSAIDLGVDAFEPGGFTMPGSSAFEGKFTGTLHLRAPRSGNDIRVDSLLGTITGASSISVEGHRLYNPAGGALDNTLRSTIHTDSTAWMDAGYAAMTAKLKLGSPSAAALDSALVLMPGVEIFNATGDLRLGTAVTGLNSEDWDLSGFRYGPMQAPGVLTLRAVGDLVFNNTLSDGFTPVTASAANGNSTMWLAPLTAAVTANGLPLNTQSWSYRLASGADFTAADFRAVQTESALPAGRGSVLVGEFYPAVPNTTTSGPTAGVDSAGLTANSIRITTGAANRTRYEVIRTGTGSIEVAAGRDVQLRNQFATIYTAGVRVPDATQIFQAGDFVLPIVQRAGAAQPNQGNLGAAQQSYPAQWSLAGGNVTIAAQGDIGRFTLVGGSLVPDSSKQLPNNWLYRRGYVDSTTGRFGEGGVGTPGVNTGQNVSDPSASTAWWIDYSNFFQGIGALGGGDITLTAGSDVINADAVIPTNARMAGRDPATGQNVAPDTSRLLELGGGDLVVRAAGNIDGGAYYLERGTGKLTAGGEITTNATRSPSLGYLAPSLQPPSVIQSVSPDVYDPATWLPVTLFVGKSNFDVSARGDVLLGPVTNPFHLPQGLNNRFWYKTYFNTYSADAGADVASFGGSVTHRWTVTLPSSSAQLPILWAWLSSQNLFTGPGSSFRSSFYQPWIRLAEADIPNQTFDTLLRLQAPNLTSTAFAGDINLVGAATLFPSPTGSLEFAASGAIAGLQPSGRANVNGLPLTVWTSASVNLSDANPDAAPGVTTPVAYTSFAGRNVNDLRESSIDPFGAVHPLFEETGSFTGVAANILTKQSLHSAGLLHRNDPEPVRLYAGGGDVSGVTLFAPKSTQVFAARDVTDVAFYIQNLSVNDISIVAAGRDIAPNNPNASVRSQANNIAQGKFVGDLPFSTNIGTQTNALPGDIQINGPGVLQVLAGRNIDLGTDPNINNGTGTGITSIGNFRNPFLPIEGADIIALAGVTAAGGVGPAPGLAGSSLNLASFIQSFSSIAGFQSAYLQRLGVTSLAGLGTEQQSIVGLEVFFRQLRDAGRNFPATGNYDSGFNAVSTLTSGASATGDLLTRARDIRTARNGSITLAANGGSFTMASDIFGNPLTPPGVVTEFGGGVSIFTDRDVDIGQARIFTLRGGDVVIWSTNGDIAAGTAPKTVVTAPPTRVLIDVTSADVTTDLGGLATGGGIGVLASVAGVKAGDVDLIAPRGSVDAGDAGIRATGNLNIAAVTVLNASNIQVGGSTSGVSSGPAVAAPNLGGLAAAGAAAGAQNAAATDVSNQQQRQEDREPAREEPNSIISVEVLGYGGGDDEEKKRRESAGAE